MYYSIVSDNKNNSQLYTSVSVLSYFVALFLSHICMHQYKHAPFSLFSSPFRFLSYRLYVAFIRLFALLFSSNTICYHIRANHNFQSGFLVLFCVGSNCFLHTSTVSISFGSLFFFCFVYMCMEWHGAYLSRSTYHSVCFATSSIMVRIEFLCAHRVNWIFFLLQVTVFFLPVRSKDWRQRKEEIYNGSKQNK